MPMLVVTMILMIINCAMFLSQEMTNMELIYNVMRYLIPTLLLPIGTALIAMVLDRKPIKSMIKGLICYPVFMGTWILIIISILSAQGLKWIPVEYIRFLGFIPIALGLRGFLNKHDEDGNPPDSDSSRLIWNVTIVTVANGADNLGVYIPLFAGFSWYQVLVFEAVFLVMIAVWCAFGYRISNVESYKNTIAKYKKAIVPLVYMILGIYILN
jgi:cadmium resistance protein CadD (predicted permease)